MLHTRYKKAAHFALVQLPVCCKGKSCIILCNLPNWKLTAIAMKD